MKSPLFGGIRTPGPVDTAELGLLSNNGLAYGYPLFFRASVGKGLSWESLIKSGKGIRRKQRNCLLNGYQLTSLGHPFIGLDVIREI